MKTFKEQEEVIYIHCRSEGKVMRNARFQGQKGAREAGAWGAQETVRHM